MDRDVNKPLRDDFAEKQPATDEERKGEKPQSPEEIEEEEAAEKQRETEVAHFNDVYVAAEAAIGDVPELHVQNQALTPAEKEAITLLYQARSGTNEMGTYASALQCKRWLNQALATLQPILSTALEPELQEVLIDEFKDMQERIGELKVEIRSRILKEAHKGRMKGPRKEKAAEGDGGRSELGSIAWELAQLVKKRKRAKLPYDAAANPVIAALEAMQADALELGKLALEVARADERRAREDDDANRAAVDEAVGRLEAQLRAFLDRCREGAGDAAAPGAHSVLAERFAPLVARLSDGMRAEAVASLAADVVAEIHECLDEVDAIVTAAAGGTTPEKKRGVLSSLFGRKKS